MISVEKVRVNNKWCVKVRVGHRTTWDRYDLTEVEADLLLEGMKVFADKHLVSFN